ncbi:MAG: hypothetical protein WAZ21_03590 [Candidatus Saccharimonadales bacterium]
MIDSLTMSLTLMADSSGAITAMREYVTPTMTTLTALAALASVFFIVYGGILYMTSTGRPEKLDQAKRVLKNALIGVVIVLGAGTLTAILNGAMPHTQAPASSVLPTLEAIKPESPSNGLVEILINAIVGLLNTIIQTLATPFLGALDFFTKSTPLMADNPSVFNFWLAMVGITDVLFVIVIALIGFHVMSAATFGLDEIDFKHLLPRILLIFLLLNTSLFIIDGFIAASNALITAVGHIGGASSVWNTLTTVFKEAGGQSIAALLIMLVFLIFSFILLIYYVGRIVTLFIGAVLSPLVILIWLVPGFRDFSETAMKTYLTTIFILFVHVVILTLAGSLFTGLSGTSGNDIPNVLMSMVVGLAAVIALLKTQGLLMQFSYVSLGARSSRQLGTQFMNGVSYLGGRGKAAVGAVSNKVGSRSARSSLASTGSRRGSAGGTVHMAPTNKKQPPSVKVTRVPATGTTSRAPKVGTANASPRVASVTDIATKRNAQTTSTKEDKAA